MDFNTKSKLANNMWWEKHMIHLLNVAKAFPNMQDSTSHPFDLNKRQIFSRWYDVSPDGGTWNQVHKQDKTRQLMLKSLKKQKWL